MDTNLATQPKTKEDFNLTSLIETVERDMHLLEQMERGQTRGGGDLRHLDLPPLDPLPEDIMQLPGFRPKQTGMFKECAIFFKIVRIQPFLAGCDKT